MRIAELPFHEQPALALLNLREHRDAPDATFAGYGWTRVDRIWLSDARGIETAVDDALVVAVHSADDAEAIADDVELEFELPGGRAVSVLASTFLAAWLPVLPTGHPVVLAMCNAHRAHLRPLGAPLFYGMGDVESWLDDGARIRLAAETWYTLSP